MTKGGKRQGVKRQSSMEWLPICPAYGIIYYEKTNVYDTKAKIGRERQYQHRDIGRQSMSSDILIQLVQADWFFYFLGL